MTKPMMGALMMCALLVGAAGTIAQEKTVMVGGAAMFPSKDIIDNAVNSKDHTTLVAAVKAAGYQRNRRVTFTTSARVSSVRGTRRVVSPDRPSE